MTGLLLAVLPLLDPGAWTAAPSDGVSAVVSEDQGAVRLDVDFHGGGGFLEMGDGADELPDADVAVPPVPQQPRMVGEPGEPLGVGDQVLGERFDRDEAVETRVARQKDHTHPAAAELADDFEWAEGRGVHV